MKTNTAKKRFGLLCLALGVVTLLFFCVSALAETEPGEGEDSTFTYYTAEQMNEMLSHARIGVLSGGITQMDCERDYPEAEIYDYPTCSDSVEALLAGKVDYTLLNESQGAMIVREKSGVRATTPIYSREACFIVTKGKDALLSGMNEAIEKLREDGTIDRLYKKWTGGDYSSSDIPEVESGDVLTVVTSSGEEPLSFVYEGELTGFHCDVIRYLAYELGMKAEFMDLNFSATIAAVASGKADVAVSVNYTEERAREVAFTVPYYSENVTILMKNEAASGEKGFFAGIVDSFRGTFLTENRYRLFLSGIGVTVVISLGAYLIGTVLGLLLCLMLGSKKAIFRRLASGYAKIVTGIPILVWIMILYYVIFRSADIDGIFVAIIGFGLESAASLSGIFKTGIDSVDKGQLEAAYAMGFLPLRAFRTIVLPQAVLRVFDLYKGTFVSLVKSTSIVGYIAIVDLTKVSDLVRSRTYQAFFPLVTTAIIYFAITGIFIALLGLVQKKLNPRRRKNILKGVTVR